MLARPGLDRPHLARARTGRSVDPPEQVGDPVQPLGRRLAAAP
jgi:hypothetical protein